MGYDINLLGNRYNEHRPHMALEARTPGDVYQNVAFPPKLGVLPRSQAPPMKLTVSFFADRSTCPFSISIKLPEAAFFVCRLTGAEQSDCVRIRKSSPFSISRSHPSCACEEDICSAQRNTAPFLSSVTR